MHAAPAHCPLCRIEPRRTIRLVNGERLLRCPQCGLGWWNWPPFDPAAFYDVSYYQDADQRITPAHNAAKGYRDYAALGPGMQRTARARLRRITRILPTARPSRLRLLEIGCGVGIFLEEARRIGWEAVGVEVSAYAAAKTRERGLEVYHAAIEDVSFADDLNGPFDVVALWDTIEHLRDAFGVLRRAAAALRPGGVLALSTGDLTSLCARLSGPRWHLFNLPEHLYFFTPAALRGMLAAAGCTIRTRVCEVNWAPLAYLVERLEKTMFGRLPLGRLRNARLLLPATLADVIGVYAVYSGPHVPSAP